ncbi:MAG TPA: hypothetical protein VNP92_31005 [Actinophytocola sp.]|nr:hypothetical protein [Actinophytocola sp.]
MEQAIVRGVRVGPARSVLTVGLSGDTATTVSVLRVVARHAAALTRTPVGPGRAELVCTVATSAAPRLLRELAALHPLCEHDMVEVTLYGEGLRSDPVIAPTFCEALAREGISLRLLTIGGTALSVVCGAGQVPAAVRALGEAFELPAGGVVRRGRVSQRRPVLPGGSPRSR